MASFDAPPKILAGVDGGGSGCRAAVEAAGGSFRGYGTAGPANIRTDPQEAARNIVAAVRAALEDAGQDARDLSQVVAVLGLAGANVGDHAARLQPLLPFAASHIETDVAIALEGALGPGDGAVAILGTGTAYLRRRNGKTQALGGWGFELGDQGSGAWMGRQLLEEALLVHDGIHAGSTLAGSILSEFGNNPSALVDFSRNARPADYARFAPRIVEASQAGDQIAARILAGAVSSISEALDALRLEEKMPLSLLGGLAPVLAPLLPERHRARLVPARQDALGGALGMAARIFAPEAAAHG